MNESYQYSKQVYTSNPRRKELERYTTEGETIQREVMEYLIERAKDTEYGRKHLFSTIKSYDDFIQNVPVNTYEELKAISTACAMANEMCYGQDR